MARDKGLDEEFKWIMSDMKPHTKILPYKSEERHRVTLWIKKLLGLRTHNYTSLHSTVPLRYREERNAYARQLLQMLKAGKLEEPFTSSPPTGHLQTVGTDSLVTAKDTEPIVASSPTHTFSHHTPTTSTFLHLPPSSSSTAHAYAPLKPATNDHTPVSPTAAGKLNGASSTGERQSKHAPFLHPSITPPLSAPSLPAKERKEGHLKPPKHPRHLPHSPKASPETQPSPLSGARLDDGGGSQERRPPTMSPPLKQLSGAESESPSASLQPTNLGVATLLQTTPRPHPKMSAVHPYRESELKPVAAGPSPLSASSQGKGGLTRELLHQRELDLLLRSAETSHQEEKLLLQRQHEDSVQQLLQRKARELESVREEFGTQLQLLEAEKRQLEMSVVQLQGEHEGGRERDALQTSFHLSSEQTRGRLQAEFDRKLHRTITDFEQQKLDMEQRHSKHVQQVVKDCNNRIDQMERNCSTQISTSSAVVAELEGRVKELTQQNMTLSHQLSSEKASSRKKCHSLDKELQAAHKNIGKLTEELALVLHEKEKQLRETETKMESHLREREEQHSQEKVKLLEQVSELQQQLTHWQRTVEEMGASHRREMAEIEGSLQQQTKEKELQYQQKLSSLQEDTWRLQQEAEEREAQLQYSLRLSEEKLARMTVARERQTQQAEQAIKGFKMQVEQRSSELFSGLKRELQRLEGELVQCREERDRHVWEFEKQRQQDREEVERQLHTIELKHQEELDMLRKQHSTELEAKRKRLERTREQEVAQLQHRLTELQTQTKSTASHNTKIISSLEQKVQQLQQEMESQRTRHSREAARLRKRIEEEKQTASRIQEAAVSRLKAQWEEEEKRLRQLHQKEMSAARSKHNQKIQQMEHAFATESAKTVETITALQAQVKFLQEDLARQRVSYEEQLTALDHQREEERSSRSQHHDMMVQSLRQEADASQQLAAELQEKIAQIQEDYEAKLSTIRLQSESTLKGMLPATIRKEYEDTIQSLKRQVQLLEQRRALLQQELEQRRLVSGSRAPPTHSVS